MRLTTLIGEKIDEAYTVYMINLLLLTLSLANTQPTQTAQFKPCVWPNVCKNEAPVAPVIEVAQFTTCVYPRKCGKSA